MSLDYDAAGNITSKAGKPYDYGLTPGATGCTYQAGPHAVSTYDGVTYCYDINGNNTDSSDGRLITYTAYNKPSRIELGSDASEFYYGPSRSRYRRVEKYNEEVIEEAFYIGNTEIIDKDDGLRREYRRNIGGIAIEHFYLRLDGSAGGQTDYVLTDNLGSPHTLLDELGQITYRVGFDPHGSRRQGYDPRTLIVGINPTEDVTDRGFTGHEHLDVLGVIHMNGRIYDPKLGRFLQADPLIQDLGNAQSLNRYTYVFNNPLAYTDPSGYGVFSKYIRPILGIGIAWATGGWAASLFQAGNTAAALAVSVGGGALAGAIATGSGKGALIGAFTGAAAFGVGSSIAGGNTSGINNAMARAGAQALAGGLQGQVNNGNFGAGFVAGFSVEYDFETAIAFNGGAATSVGRGNRARDLTEVKASNMTADEFEAVFGSSEDWLAYESVGTMQQEKMQRDYQAGRIGIEQLNSFYEAQAEGALFGLGGFGGLGVKSAAGTLAIKGGQLARWLNTGRHLRIGTSRWGGRKTFRVAGDVLGKIPEPIRARLGIKFDGKIYKWDWFDLGPL